MMALDKPYPDSAKGTIGTFGSDAAVMALHRRSGLPYDAAKQ
jgi:hypothetical protein